MYRSGSPDLCEFGTPWDVLEHRGRGIEHRGLAENLYGKTGTGTHSQYRSRRVRGNHHAILVTPQLQPSLYRLGRPNLYKLHPPTPQPRLNTGKEIHRPFATEPRQKSSTQLLREKEEKAEEDELGKLHSNGNGGVLSLSYRGFGTARGWGLGGDHRR